MRVFRRIGRAIERFNRGFEKTALAASVDSGTGPGIGGSPSQTNAVGVKAVVGEIEQQAPGSERQSK
jgi:hypothetical protein